MLTAFEFSLRLLRKECYSWSWRILILAIVIAISAVTALNFYTGNIRNALYAQSTQLLGGDLVVTSSTSIPLSWIEQAKQFNLNTAESWIYASVAMANTHMQLVNIQAVSDDYPLVGDRDVRPSLSTVWVEPRLLTLMGRELKQTIKIGQKDFVMAALLTADVATLNAGWVMAPRVLMRLQDVPSTKTVIPGSRVEYQLLLTGNPANIKQFREWISLKLQPGQRLITARGQQSIIDTALRNAENYLQLALLVCLLISGVAISLSVRDYLIRHYDEVALWRCIGLDQKHIIYTFIFLFIFTALIASCIGILLGYFAQACFAYLAKDLISIHLLSFSILPVLKGLVTGIFLLFAFGLPIILELPRTSPLYLWRHEVVQTDSRRSIYIVLSLLIFMALLYWIVDFSLDTLFYIDLILIMAGLLYIIQLALLNLINYIAKYTTSGIRQGLMHLIHHPDSTGIQFSALTLVFMTLVILSVVKNNLILDWTLSLPPKTPNYFAFNIAMNDIPELKRLFSEYHIHVDNIYPIVRGRLIMLNQKPILPAIPASGRYHNALRRELNLSSMQDYPSDNHIVLGKVWPASTSQPLISVEQSLANALNIKLGDSLTFRIGDKEVDAKVWNIRTLNWASFHPNFYVIFSPQTLDEFTQTYMTSFYLPNDKILMLNEMIKVFPNITIIDSAKLLIQLQELVSKISLSIQFIFLFSFIAGLLVVMVSLLNSMEERRETYSLLRTLGASKHYIYSSIVTEYLCLFSLIVFTAFLLGNIVIWGVKGYLFT